MWTYKIYGLVSIPKDEKSIMAGINNYLATISRDTSKAKTKSMLDARLPFVYKYFYWNLNKDTGTWLEIFPNADLNEKWFDAGHKDSAWILKVIFHDDVPDYDYGKSAAYMEHILNATGKDYKKLGEGTE